MRTRARLALAATLVALLIAACGSGGGDKVTKPRRTITGSLVDPTTFRPGDATFAVPGGVLRAELVRPSDNLSLPS